MAREYTPNRRYPLYTDADKPNLRDQYNGAIREIDADIVTALDNAQDVADGMGSGFDAQHTVRSAIDSMQSSVDSAVAGIAGKANASDLTALAAKLPTGSFTSTNTVKKYVDDAVAGMVSDSELTALANKLPASEFTSSNTIKDYVDRCKNGKLRNRKIICIGDSLTYSATHHATTYWPEFLQSTWGCTCYNFAHGGVGFIATTSSSTKTFKKQLEDAVADTSFNNFDITDIIILGGVNDYAQSSSDLQSAVADCINYARSNFRNANIHTGFMIKGTKPLGKIHSTAPNLIAPLEGQAVISGACIIDSPWAWMNYQGYDYGDGIHVLDGGQRRIAGMIASHLMGGESKLYRFNTLTFDPAFVELIDTSVSTANLSISNGYVHVSARGAFQNVSLPTGNVDVITTAIQEWFSSGFYNTTNQLLAPLNPDQINVTSGSYSYSPRVYFNGSDIKAQFLSRIYTTTGARLFGFELQWPLGI